MKLSVGFILIILGILINTSFGRKQLEIEYGEPQILHFNSDSKVLNERGPTVVNANFDDSFNGHDDIKSIVEYSLKVYEGVLNVPITLAFDFQLDLEPTEGTPDVKASSTSFVPQYSTLRDRLSSLNVDWSHLPLQSGDINVIQDDTYGWNDLIVIDSPHANLLFGAGLPSVGLITIRADVGDLYDLNLEDGLDLEMMDLSALIVRTIGNLLGFKSNVDEIDRNIENQGNTSPIPMTVCDLLRFPEGVLLEMFSFETSSRVFTSNYIENHLLYNGDEFLSVSSGVFFGNGYSANLWFPSEIPMGIFDPILSNGVLLPLSMEDLSILSMMGWSYDDTAPPVISRYDLSDESGVIVEGYNFFSSYCRFNEMEVTQSENIVMGRKIKCLYPQNIDSLSPFSLQVGNSDSIFAEPYMNEGTTTGTTGEPSTTGTTGEPVTTGTTGEPVTTGTTGEPVTTGTTGEPVTTGTTGEPVTTGTTGEPSTTGTTGEPSTTGTTGEPSTTGTTGEPVTTGTTGEPATTGTTGEPVTTGTTGEPVTTGTTGEPVTTGTTGEPVTTGTTGEPVTTGTTGEPATTGVPSTTGETTSGTKQIVITQVTPSHVEGLGIFDIEIEGEGIDMESDLFCDFGGFGIYEATVENGVVHCEIEITQDSPVGSSQAGSFLRLVWRDQVSNSLPFFLTVPPHIDSAVMQGKNLQIVGTNFKNGGLWCEFDNSVTTRATTRGKMGNEAICPPPKDVETGRVRIFQDGQYSNWVEF